MGTSVRKKRGASPLFWFFATLLVFAFTMEVRLLYTHFHKSSDSRAAVERRSNNEKQVGIAKELDKEKASAIGLPSVGVKANQDVAGGKGETETNGDKVGGGGKGGGGGGGTGGGGIGTGMGKGEGGGDKVTTSGDTGNKDDEGRNDEEDQNEPQKGGGKEDDEDGDDGAQQPFKKGGKGGWKGGKWKKSGGNEERRGGKGKGGKGKGGGKGKKEGSSKESKCGYCPPHSRVTTDCPTIHLLFSTLGPTLDPCPRSQPRGLFLKRFPPRRSCGPAPTRPSTGSA
jgi:hypothetical protein